MLPFAIISTYGNEVQPVEGIKKIEGSASGSLLLLSHTNELWVRGINTFNQLGTGNTNVVQVWTKIRDDVVDVFSGTFGTAVITTNNTILYSGRDSIRNTATTFVTWVDYTSAVTASGYSVQQVKKIRTGQYCLFALMNDDTLYVLGRNVSGEFGDGSAIAANTVQTIRNVASDVKDIKYDNINVGYISNSNVFYRTGSNTNYALGTGNTNSLLSFTPYTTTSEAIDFTIQSIGIILLLRNTSGVYSIFNCGVNSSFQLGIGSQTTTVTRQVLTLVSQIDSSDLGAHSLSAYGMYGTANIILSTNTFYSAGINSNGLLANGSTTNKATYTKDATGLPAIDFSTSDVKICVCGSQFLAIFYNGSIYAAGLSTAFGLNSTTFVNVGSYPF